MDEQNYLQIKKDDLQTEMTIYKPRKFDPGPTPISREPRCQSSIDAQKVRISPPSCSAVQSRRMRGVTIACLTLPYLGDWYWTLPYLGGVCQDTALSGRGLEHLDYALSE